MSVKLCFFVYLFCFTILELKKRVPISHHENDNCKQKIKADFVWNYIIRTIPRNYGHYGTTKSLYQQRGVRTLLKWKLTFNWNKPKKNYICIIKVTISNLRNKIYIFDADCVRGNTEELLMRH